MPEIVFKLYFSSYLVKSVNTYTPQALVYQYWSHENKCLSHYNIGPRCWLSWFHVQAGIDDLCFRTLMRGVIRLCSLPAGSRWDTFIPLLPVWWHSSHGPDQEQTLPSPHEQRATRLHLHSPTTEVRSLKCSCNTLFIHGKVCVIYCMTRKPFQQLKCLLYADILCIERNRFLQSEWG